MFKQADSWNIVSFVSLTLIAEYLHHTPKLHYPKFYYWNGERELRRRLADIKKRLGP